MGGSMGARRRESMGARRGGGAIVGAHHLSPYGGSFSLYVFFFF